MNTIRVITEDKRKCGYRKGGGFYLVAELDEKEGVLAPITLIDPPILVEGKQSRGYVIVNGDNILERMPEEDWFAGATKDRKDKDRWSIETFGMPLERRRKIGVCKGFKTEEECVLALSNRAYYTSDLIKLVRVMGITGINDLAPSSYASLVSAVQEADPLKTAASLHRMVSEAGRRKKQVLPSVMVGLTKIGLIADCVDLAKGV